MRFADVLSDAGFVVVAVTLLASMTGVADRSVKWAGAAIFAWAQCVAFVLVPVPFMAAYFGLLGVLFTYLWWRNRRNGRWKRAARELGAKSRARVEALARQMTPSPIPTLVGGS